MTGFLERIAAGDADAVRAALADAPELAALRTADGVSAVLHAMYVNQREIASDIASAKGTLDAFEAAALGRSVELRAALAGQPAAATALTDDGFTALHYAAFFGDGACAQALLEAGADPHAVARNSMRVQPLHSAAAARNLAVAEAAARVRSRSRCRAGRWLPSARRSRPERRRRVADASARTRRPYVTVPCSI